MNGDVMGGGVVVAVAAALWLAYLVPVWLRRREYLATERNAVRLQQTLRILAETSELPDEVRMEATAKTVAEQQRILRRAEAKRTATVRAEAAAHARREQAVAEERRLAAEDAERAATEALAVEQAARAAAARRARALATASAPRPAVSTSRRRRLRRARAVATLLLVAGVAGVLAGLPGLVSTGAWLLPIASAVAAGASLLMLARLARPVAAAPSAPYVPAAPVGSALYDDAQHDLPVQERLRQSWTPRPLPKPLHLSPGTIAAAAMASVDAAAEMRRSAARAELERRVVVTALPASMPLRPVAAVAPRDEHRTSPAETPAAPALASTPSRYASMGIVDATDTGALDLDAVLRRRRAAS